METVAEWPVERKLEEALRRSLPRLGPAARAQVEALLTPEALATIAAVLVAWVISHAFGIGEVIDIIILGAGALAIGMAVFDGVEHLYQFATRSYRARSSQDLDAAATHFAAAVSILGIQAVLAVLFRGAPKTYRGGLPRRTGPVTARGMAYRPTIRWSRYEPRLGRLSAGEGWTNSWGDIVVSSRGSARTRQLVLFHERIHQMLTPKLYPLRNFRIANREASYRHSSLSRYLEEALAETVAQVRVFGVGESFVGIRFPVSSRYVYLLRGGAGPGHSAALRGSGLLTEVFGLTAFGVVAAGMAFDVLTGAGVDEPASAEASASPAAHGASGSW
jgi:hypothetical protein